ncbi:MAG: TRAP transporter large permease [Spirochaetia bacterium]
MLVIFVGSLLAFVILGLPIVFALGLVNLILIEITGYPYIVLARQIIVGMNSFPLLAIPFFMFVGEIMNKGGIARRLVEFADSLVGHITGGLGHVNILASMFFGGISGSAIADTSAIGGLMIPPMTRQNYPAPYAAAVTAASAVIGIIIPPSIPFILFGIVTGTSISRMFLGGMIPGIIVGLALMATTYITCRRHGYGFAEGSEPKRFSFRAVGSSFLHAAPSLTIPVIIVGGILTGVFTATEAGAVAALVAFLLAMFYREVRLKDLPGLLATTARTTAIVTFLLGMAMVSAWLLTREEVPRDLALFLGSVSTSPTSVMLLATALLLVVGLVMDLTPAMLILAPIFLPAIQEFGIPDVYFGVIMSISLGIGLVTPPVGTVLYVATAVAGVRLERLVVAIIPFVLTLFGVLILLLAFPPLVTWLPSLLN